MEEEFYQEVVPSEEDSFEQPEENFQQKKARKDFSRIGFAYLLATILFNGGQILCIYLAGIFYPQALDSRDTAMAVQMLPTYFICVPLILWMISRLPATIPERKQMKPGEFIGALPCVYTVVIVSNVVGLLFTAILGTAMDHEVQNQVEALVGEMSPLMIFLIIVICAPVVEELLFRKFLVTRTLRYGEGVSVFLSGLMFGLFHGNINQFVYAFTLGCFLAFLYVKTGNIKITIALHAFINFLGSVAVQLLESAFDMEEITNKIDELTKNGSVEELNLYVQENFAAFACYGGYGLLIVGLIVFGIILLILGRKRFRLSQKEVTLPKGKRFTTIFLNPGMLLYMVAWLTMIFLQIIA